MHVRINGVEIPNLDGEVLIEIEVEANGEVVGPWAVRFVGGPLRVRSDEKNERAALNVLWGEYPVIFGGEGLPHWSPPSPMFPPVHPMFEGT